MTESNPLNSIVPKHTRTWDLPAGDIVTLSVYDGKELDAKLTEPLPPSAGHFHHWTPDVLFLVVLTVNGTTYMYTRSNIRITGSEEVFKEYEAIGPAGLLKTAIWRLQESHAPLHTAMAAIFELTRFLLNNETPEGLEKIVLDENQRPGTRWAALRHANTPASAVEKLVKLIDANPVLYKELRHAVTRKPELFPEPVVNAVLKHHGQKL